MSDPRTSSDDALDLHLHAEEVSRAYRAGVSEEPPPELDDAIRAAARRGGGWRPPPLGRSPLRAWGVPLAVAATLVVGVSVAFLAADRHDPRPEQVPATPPAEAARSKPDPPAARERAGDATDAKASAAEPPMPPLAASIEESRPSRERVTREEMQQKRRAVRGDAADAPTAAGSPANALQGAAPPAATPEAKALSKAAPRAPVQAESDAEMPSPEVWLQRIRELKAKGDLAQAEESLRMFRRRYPDYPLPADIPPPAEVAK